MSNLRKMNVTDETSGLTAKVQALADTNDVAGLVALLTASVMHGYISGSKAVPLRVDSSTHCIQTLDYEHHEIHGGSHYFIEDVADIAINNVFDVQWTTPDTDQHAHLVFELNCESETEWMIYEGATISTAGTALTPTNNNRNSLNTSNATIASILNTNLTNANADTPVAAATEIAHGIVGAGRDGGVVSRGREIMLKRNTIYCMRAIANTAGYVNFLMSWYEHTEKN